MTFLLSSSYVLVLIAMHLIPGGTLLYLWLNRPRDYAFQANAQYTSNYQWPRHTSSALTSSHITLMNLDITVIFREEPF